MRRHLLIGLWLLTGTPLLPLAAQGNAPPQQAAAPSLPIDNAPLPDTRALLSAVEQNQKKLESLQRDYTYHVHSDQQELTKTGAVKKSETEDSESLTIDGIRVNRVVARNGKPLTPEEQQKENQRIDREVAKAKERRTKMASKGDETDERGHDVMPLSRILELGSFSNPRRANVAGRPAILLDYAGNPQAKTHSTFEGIMRDVVGTVWIDEADQVMERAEGQFLNDFKLGGGLLADVRKGTNFQFQATRVGDGVWLPAAIDGKGSVRLLLFANFNGHMHLTTSDYKRFHTSATIVGSHGVIGPDGVPLPASADPANETAPTVVPKAGTAAPHP